MSAAASAAAEARPPVTFWRVALSASSEADTVVGAAVVATAEAEDFATIKPFRALATRHKKPMVGRSSEGHFG